MHTYVITWALTGCFVTSNDRRRMRLAFSLKPRKPAQGSCDYLQPGREVSLEINSASTWILHFQPPELRENKFGCVSRLLWQPEQTNAASCMSPQTK